MKNWIKKQWSNILFFGFILAFFFVPGVKEFVQRPLLMSPSLEKNEIQGQLSVSDYDISLRGINVPDVNLSDFKDKNLFLNFWGSWCPPCRTEFPSIQELYNAKGEKIAFVLIAMQDEEEKVRAFLEKNNYTTPVYMIDHPLPQSLDFRVFPTTFIINKKGEILKKDQGASNWNSEKVHQFIDSLD